MPAPFSFAATTCAISTSPLLTAGAAMSRTPALPLDCPVRADASSIGYVGAATSGPGSVGDLSLQEGTRANATIVTKSVLRFMTATPHALPKSGRSEEHTSE